MTHAISFSDEFAFFGSDGLEWDALPVETVSLSGEVLREAAQGAQAIEDGDRQWSAYLTTLAVGGLRTWLGDRAPDLSVAPAGQPSDDLARLQVGRFQVAVIPMGALTDDEVAMPAPVLDHPHHLAHLYVLVEVLEEQAEARIHGYFRHDQWRTWQQATPLAVDEAHYRVPLPCFLPDPDALLLDLRALDPVAIALPSAAAASAPEAVTATPDPLFAPLAEGMANRAINAARWLRDQLDTVADELGWALMPTMVPATGSALRSGAVVEGEFATTDAVTTVFEELQTSGINVPLNLSGAYRDLHWGRAAVRLHALVWDVSETVTAPEWTLLIILSPLPGHPLPVGLSLVIRDSQDILVERSVAADAPDQTLYGQVIGDHGESFWVTLDFGNGAIATLPPFTFHVD